MKKTNLHNSIGQSTVEYAVLLAIIAAALIAMQVYMKRGLQGRIRDLATQIAPHESGRGAQQYDPGRTESIYITNQTGTTVERYEGGVARTYHDPEINLDGDEEPDAPESRPEVIQRSGYEIVRPETQ